MTEQKRAYVELTNGRVMILFENGSVVLKPWLFRAVIFGMIFSALIGWMWFVVLVLWVKGIL